MAPAASSESKTTWSRSPHCLARQRQEWAHLPLACVDCCQTRHDAAYHQPDQRLEAGKAEAHKESRSPIQFVFRDAALASRMARRVSASSGRLRG